MKKFDCGIIKNELLVARDSEHHYITKFILRYGEWMIGNKRGYIRIKKHGIGIFCPHVTMTMGYYEKPVKLGMHIKESSLNLLMEMAYNNG